MTFGGLTALVLLAMFLVYRFDETASIREQRMVDQGFARQIKELDAVIVPQANWDDAVKYLDNTFNPDWTDRNFGSYLYTFNGFTRSFVLNADGEIIYASVNGKRAGVEAFAGFAEGVRHLIRSIRKAEIRRPPLRAQPHSLEIITPPIQASGLIRSDGQLFIVIGTLIQPDFGTAMPKGARAPIAITAMPVDNAMLTSFAARYLVDDLQLLASSKQAGDKDVVSLRGPDGKEVAALAWAPRRPGSALLDGLTPTMILVLALLVLAAWTILRRSGIIVSELIASEGRARHLAYHDTLTKLPNRALLFDRLTGLLAEIENGKGALAILCVDLDRFKDVNDTMGHGAGDALIEAVADRLRAVCDEASTIARLGGDEFVVLQTTDDLSQLASLADRILASIGGPVDSEFGPIEIGCSIGIAVVDRVGVEASQALRWADLALYRSKQLGRRCVTFFEPEMDAELSVRRSLEVDLRAALTDGTLHMVYQPQVNRQDEIVAVEALVRWTHPVRGIITPDAFVPIAEECGLILPLGEFVLRRVFEETREWTSIRVAVNVSPVQMRSPGFAPVLMRLAASAGIDPANYELELTETALLGDDPVTRGNFDALTRFGFSIALDDFGTGYSSLSLLQRFKVSKIKIDRSFIACLGDGEGADALVGAVVKLAKAFKLSVIGEGVETEAQRQRLIECGCHEFQGYLCGLPMAAMEIARCYDALAARRSAIKRRA